MTYAWEPQTIFPAGTHIRVDAKSWTKNGGTDGTHNSDWSVNMEMNSQASSQQLDVLKKDAAVPGVGGFEGQFSVEEFLAEESLPGDDEEDEDETETGSDRVTICHKPHKNGGTTKSVKRKRMSKHIAHGDYTGACTGWNPHGDD